MANSPLRTLRELVERISGLRLFRKRSLPRGIDLFHDLRAHVPGFAVETIFDVGANVGQSTEELKRHFPASTVYCFEPSSRTFATLEASMRSQSKVRCFNFGLGREPGPRSMIVQGNSLGFRICDTAESGTTTEVVEVSTIDKFCDEHSIARIDFLKIDTEGFDLDVLVGASRMLTENKVVAIQVEAGMHPNNQRHVPLSRLSGFVEDKGFALLGIYEQVGEFETSSILRRCNPVFINLEHLGVRSRS